MKTLIAAPVALALITALLFQADGPRASGAEASSSSTHTSRHYSLPATPENVQWG